MKDTPRNFYDTLVIGAGMAGLSAARTLAGFGQRVLVLEAQDRIGGRIFTKHLHGEVLELGAEFIHGRAPELWSLIEEAGLETYERDGDQLCFEDSTLAACTDSRDQAFDILEDLKDLTGPDLSFADYLDRKQIPAEQRPAMVNFIEGFNAADHRIVSALALGCQQRAEDAIEGDRAFAVRGGYHQLIEFLASKIAAAHGEIRIKLPVRSIRWQAGSIEADTDEGTFFAARAVITLPLGVLQANSVRIIPAPGDILEQASRMRMGQVRRVTLLFRERFWSTHPAAAELSFLFATDAMPPVWWTQHPSASNTLTGWVGGPRSAALAELSSEALTDYALGALGRIFSLSKDYLRALLLACESNDWQRDPAALGAYSYIATGGLDAPAQMSRPIADTLYFAGEHTDITGHWGTVHAALRSGLRAADQILASTPHRKL